MTTIIFILWTFLSHGAEKNISSSAHELEKSKMSTISTSRDLNTELELLKLQIELTTTFQEKLLSTVYWSLGTIASVVTVLVGFGWFANYKVYERDKEAIKSEANALIKNYQQENQVHFDSQIGKLETQISEKLKADQSLELEKLKINFDEKIKYLSTEIQALKHDSKSGLANVTIELENQSREKWIQMGVYINALRSSINILELAITNKFKYRIERGLDFILEDLNKIFSKGMQLDSGVVSKLSKQFDLLDSSHAANINSIYALMEKIKTPKS